MFHQTYDRAEGLGVRGSREGYAGNYRRVRKGVQVVLIASFEEAVRRSLRKNENKRG